MRRFFLAVTALWLSAAILPGKEPARIVVLGFDGVDAQITEQMMAAGRLPNLAALKARGAYSPLTPTVPAQTPVSWATFSTGLDPGGHEIFDFLKRDPADRIPTFAVAQETSVPFLLGSKNPFVFGAGAALLVFAIAAAAVAASRHRARRRGLGLGLGIACGLLAVAAGAAAFLAVRAWVPQERPGVKNNRRGKTFWAEAGARPATVMRMPVTFPPERFERGRQLSGLGVPDLSGRIVWAGAAPNGLPGLGSSRRIAVSACRIRISGCPSARASSS